MHLLRATFIKNNISGQSLQMKCTRFIREIRKYVLCIHKTLQCEERWAKRMTCHSYYKGLYSSKLMSENNVRKTDYIRYTFLTNGLIYNYKYYEKSRNTPYVLAKFYSLNRVRIP